MKRVVVDKEQQDIELRQCVPSKWYVCRSTTGAIYTLTHCPDFFFWSCVSAPGERLGYDQNYCHREALEAGMSVGEVLKFDSLAELGYWLAEE